MSCHNIGRGMNSVVEVVIALLDSGKIDAEAARTIVAACREGVNWCDGNEDEAVESIRRCRCGKCMKAVAKGEFLFSVWDTSQVVRNLEFQRCSGILDYGNSKLASDGLCLKCFDEVVNEFCTNPSAGAEERDYIMKRYNEEKYRSKGNGQ